MAEGQLQTDLYQDGSKHTLFVTGELDVASAPDLKHAVAHALDGQGGEFWVDVSGLKFMDSTGAAALIHIHDRVEALGRRLVVVSPTPAVRRVIDLMELDRVLDVRDAYTPA